MATPNLRQALEALSAGEQEIPNGYQSAEDIAKLWRRSPSHSSRVLRQLAEAGKCKVIRVLRKASCGALRARYFYGDFDL